MHTTSSNAGPSPETQHNEGTKRHECVGISYFNAWMRTHGVAPMCIGFSQVREIEGEPVDSRPESNIQPDQTSAQQQEQLADFKVVLEYPSQTETSSMDKHSTAANHLIQSSPTEGKQQQQTTSPAAGHAQQQQELSDTLQEPPRQQLHLRFASKATQNANLLLGALHNEGPIKLKPMPGSLQEAYNRLHDTAAKNGGKLCSVGARAASNAYNATIKPLTSLWGTATERPKS